MPVLLRFFSPQSTRPVHYRCEMPPEVYSSLLEIVKIESPLASFSRSKLHHRRQAELSDSLVASEDLRSAAQSTLQPQFPGELPRLMDTSSGML